MAGDIYIQDSPSGPVSGGAVSVTPSDATTYDPPLRGIYLNATGSISIVFADGSTFSGSPIPGLLHPFCGVYKVMSTGTTATGIYGFRA